MTRRTHDNSVAHRGMVPASQLPPRVMLTLTNKSGGSLVAGDVVIVDTTNNEAITTVASAQSTIPLGVVQETIANNAAGLVAVAGYVPLVNTTGSVTRGHYVESSGTVKKAQGNSTRRDGSFGIFLTGGTTPTALLFGISDITIGGGGGGGGTTLKSAKAHGTSADTITSGNEEKVTISDATDWDDWGTMISGDDFVVPTGQGGKFLIEAGCQIMTNGPNPTTGYAELSIRNTGGGTYYDKMNSFWDEIAGVGYDFPHCTAVVALADAATVSLWVANGTDKDLGLNNGGGPFCGWITITKLS
jgi:hypothetical protein